MISPVLIYNVLIEFHVHESVEFSKTIPLQDGCSGDVNDVAPCMHVGSTYFRSKSSFILGIRSLLTILNICLTGLESKTFSCQI